MLGLPSPAMVVACVALTVALGGTAYAVTALPRNSVGSTQIRTGAVRASEVRDRSLLAQDFAPNQLPSGASGAPGEPGVRGATGARGLQGPKGDAGAPGASGADAVIGPGSIAPEQLAKVPAAQVRAAAAQPLLDAVRGVVHIDEPVFDTAGVYSAGSPDRLRAPRAGLYRAEGTVEWAPDAGGQRRLAIEDGESVIYAVDHRLAVAAGATVQTVSTLVKLAAEASVVLVAEAQGTTAGAGTSLSGARLSLVYLGSLG